MNASGPFWRLRNDEDRRRFDEALYDLTASASFTVTGIVIDKLRLKEEDTAPLHPYHLGLTIILERYCGWLNHANRTGDVMVESRGGREDRMLKAVYQQVHSHGSARHPSAFFCRARTSGEPKLRRKVENVAGLQLADLVASAIRDDGLIGHGRLQRPNGSFDSALLPCLARKYHCTHDGTVMGVGKMLVPK